MEAKSPVNSEEAIVAAIERQAMSARTRTAARWTRLVGVASVMAACARAEESPASDEYVPDSTSLQILQRGGFETFSQGLYEAGVESGLSEPGPFTVFAPSNAAFEAIPPNVLTRLRTPSHAAAWSIIVRHHIAIGDLRTDATEAVSTTQTMAGSTLPFHVADRDHDDAIGGRAAIIFVNDIQATNGRIHQVDAVLFPSVSDMLALYRDDQSTFTTFLRALEATGMTAVLEAGPCTVFAPDERAFAALGETAVAALFADPARLSAVVTAHVIDGATRTSPELTGSVPARTGTLVFAGTADALTVQSGGAQASVKLVDVPTNTALVHFIDRVLVQ